MPDEEKPKEPVEKPKKTTDREDKLNRLLSGVKPDDQRSKGSAGKKLPTAQELESEWEQKIKDAKKTEQVILPEEAPEAGKRAKSLEEVFTQLKGRESTAVGEKEGVGRLGKIRGAVRGDVPAVTERELMGTGVPGLYKIYPLGAIPPFNLLSRVLQSASKDSLDNDLKKANIPLYVEEYAEFSVAISFIFSILVAALVFLLSFNLIFAILALFLSLLLLSFLMLNIPSLQVQSGSRDVDRQLPFALRHMSALLRAGISIFDSMVSVSKAEYGTLSMELDKVVWDVKSGENLAESLEDASNRINSHSFTRVTIHIRRALQMGGDVSKIITQIADDLTFEMRMKISDFVEKLNAFAIVYIIGGIVGPVVISVFSIVGVAQSSGIGGGALSVGADALAFMILILFPLLMVIITYVIKLMEPKV